MQKPTFKRVYVSLATILILILHFPLLSAHHKPVNGAKPVSVTNEAVLKGDLENATINNNLLNSASALYDSMDLDLMGLSKTAFDYAIKGFNYLAQTGSFANDHIISIVDFSLPSSKKRLFVIDLDQAKVLFNTYVAHGAKSGAAMATEFSNTPESNKSSLGFYETLQTYSGGHGYSLKLQGLERGINDNANSRAIVIHPAAYVDEALIRSQGYIGRSWGCPALPERLSKPIINTIKGGTCLFLYSPDKNYLNKSKIINA
ncbi:MAG: murein L,D-transpeptidase catalytic domain family protein [Ferruginibacter sp.]